MAGLLKPTSGQVHRFRDAVAVATGTGETVYITPADARALAAALINAAESCETEAFASSRNCTVSFNFNKEA